MIWQAWEAHNNNILGAINTQNQYSNIEKKIFHQYSNTHGGSLHFIQQLLSKTKFKYKHGVCSLLVENT